MKTTQKLNKPRLLIVGCGDIGMRLLPLLARRFRIFAVTRSSSQQAKVRAAGAIPLQVNLDHAASLACLAGLADRVIHLAPPPGAGPLDQRTRNLLAILPERCRLIYISTTGVYGDCGGAWLDETRTVAPQSERAIRRVDAEQALRAWAVRSHSRLVILRVPGIYSAQRLPLTRLQNGTPALLAAEDVWTNHIHADDLAQIILQALWHGCSGRVYHASDDTRLLMGDYFDVVADAFALPRPPRLPREQLQQQVSPLLLSFMTESRRLHNARIKYELGVRLRYPTVQDGVQAGLQNPLTQMSLTS